MKPGADDPGSLSGLHDIIMGQPAPWWPPAPAWYLLGVLLLLGTCLTMSWMILGWRENRYRRAGLSELLHLEQDRSREHAALVDLAELLKRVALVAYPRQQVASLSGTEWLLFLDQTLGTTEFTAGPGRQLIQVYQQNVSSPSPELVQLAREWIRRHRRDARC